MLLTAMGPSPHARFHHYSGKDHPLSKGLCFSTMGIYTDPTLKGNSPHHPARRQRLAEVPVNKTMGKAYAREPIYTWIGPEVRLPIGTILFPRVIGHFK
jgi:hypothetical protein